MAGYWLSFIIFFFYVFMDQEEVVNPRKSFSLSPFEIVQKL